MICTAANGLWLAGCLREAARYRRATNRVREEQQDILSRLLRANQETEFGRRHGFAATTDVREYQARVPIRSYDDYEADIARIAAGEQRILTAQPVRLFEPTGGSVSPTKLIPYTSSLQHEFERGIQPWIADLFLSDPRLMDGQAYWSISPPAAGRAARTTGGIPIGFEDDSHYVGGWQRALVQAVMAAPPSIRHAPDIPAFQYQTVLALVRSHRLRLISIWNPSFLSVLLDQLPSHADALLQDLKGDRGRADALRAALRASTPGERHAVLWPHLRLVSCWTDANASRPAATLAYLFPQARIQGKGLMATEAFVSLPLAGANGSALAVRSHFFEFAPMDARGEADERAPALADELEAGRRYTVILSTGGGLYRYRLNDVVEVIGHLRECPLIRFDGKHEYVSDWFGEKLHEAHVATVLRNAFTLRATLAVPPFALLACDRELARPAYVLYVESEAEDAALVSVASTIEQNLRANFHYDYARILGQLGPVRVFRTEGAAATWLATGVAAGQRAGGIKPLALDRRDGWSQRFHGGFIPTPSRSTPSGSAPLRPAL
jgi:hypothetical protein